MKGEFHSPNLDHEFFPGYVCHEPAGAESYHCSTGDHVNLFFSQFADGIFAIDRLMFVRILMTILLVLFFIFAMRKPQIVPKGLQNVGELCIDFVRIHIAEEILGKKEARRFMPVIATIFFLVLVGNLPSVIPMLNVSPNARVGMPLTLAILSYVVFIYAGAKKHGFFRFMKASVVIPGLPILLYPLVIVIEFFSTFVLRPVTLTIRLMANMLAGHLILVLLFAATNFFVWQLNAWTVLGGFTLVAATAFTLFELLVIFLQAYIFALLSAVYIELSLHADEH
ncbi:F0F1 ATP synthase subunit A [Corynebacterium mendelii]|uniref:ATP synthase subunit a n=1 Tax=Corynebacterium mendelii TaxID=2765362 RepID=A0A939IW59_9CORY|nr:F0F1 ATP synthase subunit A [Corynebacterium mendelii]MBN9644946.1 F0F1 ATP synthase subunit A [Corynebacterium mendelii]